MTESELINLNNTPPNPKRLDELKQELVSILDFQIKAENIEDSEKYLDKAFDRIVSIIEESRIIFSKMNPQIKDAQESEDAVLDSFGLINVPNVLDKILQVKDIIQKQIADIITDQVPEIITPPDDIPTTIEGRGVFTREFKPRFETLLFILLNDCGVKKDDLDIKVGSVSEDMFRKTPYISIYIEELKRLILVCDEEGNRTDIFDTENEGFIDTGRKKIEDKTKLEKEEFGLLNPGSHAKVSFSKDWENIIFTYLTNPLPKTNFDFSIVNRPLSFATIPEANKDGFFEDKNNDLWGASSVIARKITEGGGIWNDPKFHEILSEQKTIKLKRGPRVFDGYNLSEVIKKIEGDEELSAWLRKVGTDGFYIDNKTQEKWGSLLSISFFICGSPKLSRNPIFREQIQQEKSIKLLNNSKRVDGYRLSDVTRIIKSNEALAKYAITRPETDNDGFFIDENGDTWGTITAIVNQINLGSQAILKNVRFKELIKSLESKEVMITSSKHLGRVYRLDDVMEGINKDEIIKKFIGIFREPVFILEEDGFYIDKEGKRWSDKRTILSSLGLKQELVDTTVFNNLFVGLKTIQTQKKQRGMRRLTSYDFSEVKSRFDKLDEQIKKVERADKDGFVIDEKGNRWATVNKIAHLIADKQGMAYSARFRKILESMEKRKILIGTGIFDAYNLNEVIRQMESPNKSVA